MLGLDADEIINMKMTQNEAKCPVEKVKGKADKYDQKIIKTPIVRNGKQATVGYQSDVWKSWK